MHFSEFTIPAWTTEISAAMAVALIGYLVGRRTRRTAAAADARLADAMARAQLIAAHLEQVDARVTGDVALHQTQLNSFKSRLQLLQTSAIAPQWQKVREQADMLLVATLKLATNLSLACEQLRSQQTQLLSFSATRIDPATGLSNRRSMEEQLESLLAIHAEGKRRLALALFSIASDVNDPDREEYRLRLAASLLQDCMRENDFLARYSHDEFVVLMPQTTLGGALAFGERLLSQASAELRGAMWGGVAEAAPGEEPQKLLSRADSALYSARAEGASCLFFHSGGSVRRHVTHGAQTAQVGGCTASPAADRSPACQEPAEAESDLELITA